MAEGVSLKDGLGGGDIIVVVIFAFAADVSHVVFTKIKAIKRSGGIKGVLINAL